MLSGGAIPPETLLILDEFHERSLDVDLLFALFQNTGHRLILMSATLAGDRLAQHLGGVHLRGEGRLFPVKVQHIPGRSLLPDLRGLEFRLRTAALDALKSGGDTLVFLPGKAEIAAAQASLRELPKQPELIPLHGGLSLEEQSRAFAPSKRPKIILSTNVAETSLTVPGVTAVIDSGLLRRTRYHGGRGFLTLMPIAQDSAEQRAGRAGRTAPGRCYRLWSPEARLNPQTPPEIYRESLVPLLLAAAACRAPLEKLPFLDPPKGHAVQSAQEELEALGALEEGQITARGRSLFGLPLDPPLGRLLIEAEGSPVLDEVIDLVAALAVGRALFMRERPQDPDDDLREGGCDVLALVRAVREGDPRRHKLRGFVLQEARRIRARLRRAFKCSGGPGVIDRPGLARVALAADPRCAHLIRRRKREIAWSNGGTELSLSRESALNRELESPQGLKIEAILVFESRALGVKRRETELIITCAMPAPLRWLREAGLGRDRVKQAQRRGERVIAQIERVHARKVLFTREEVPEGAMARAAIAQCFLSGQLWPEILAQTRERLEASALQARLERLSLPEELEVWLERCLESLGVESGEDLALLSPEDLLAPALPPEQQERLDSLYPRSLSMGDARYRLEYDLKARCVTLIKVAGNRRTPPPLSWLPRFEGFRILVKDRNVVREIRG